MNTVNQPAQFPPPYKPTVDEIVANVAEDMAIEGQDLTPAQVALVREAVQEDLKNGSKRQT